MKNYLGRITLYSIAGCPHCKAAKARLKEENLQFIDVSVDRFPSYVREWVKDKTGKTSVPQIFFNEVHIGGNKELQAILDDPAQKETVLDHLQRELGDNSPLLPNPGEMLNDKDDTYDEFTCEKSVLSTLVESLLSSNVLGWNKREDDFLKRIFTLPHRKSITGESLLLFLNENKVTSDEPKTLAQNLLSEKFIRMIDPGREFRENANEGHLFREKGLYKITGNDTESWKALNTDSLASCNVQNADSMAQDIRKIILKLFANYLSENGKNVDYQSMGSSSLWQTFKQMVTQLQRVDVEGLSKDEKLAFFINIYNVLVIHGIVEKGVAANDFQRYRFFSRTSYVIGGYTLSLNDIENGILRANRSSMATLYMKPFGINDSRNALSLSEADPRIHFALNCGAKSCPPIKTFSGDDVQSQLDLATSAFLENDDAIVIDAEKNVVYLSQLFKWYEVDFGSNHKEVLLWILNYLEEPTKRALLEEIIKKTNYSVSYLHYDWGNNGKDE